jgi:DNA-binding NarL/FixJ family response regulator
VRRSGLLDDVLEQFTAPGLTSSVVSDDSAPDDAFRPALRGLEHFARGDFAAMVDPATTALRLAADPDALSLARAVAGLTIAGWPDAVGDAALRDPAAKNDPAAKGDPLLAAAADDAPLSPELRPVLLHLLAEAALACARIDLAAAFVERMGPVPDTLFGRRHPYLTVMRVLRVRVNAFQGRVAAARDLLDAAVDGATTPVESLFARAAACLVGGNADDRKGARQVAELVESSDLAPVTLVTRGCFMLAAYGSIAIGEIDRAARLVLTAGGDPALDRLMIVDRALGLELLTSSAVAADDLDAAEAWLARAAPLGGHPVAASTVARMQARVALLAGDAEAAVEHSERAIELARADSRLIEAAEGEILLARARIAATRRGEAAHRLEDVVTDALGQGHLAVRRSASRELREVGRRLPPAVSSGLGGLSAREIEVAARMAHGLSNASIARELYLSEHTVRIHVSRVLHAFGVATRMGVATALAPTASTEPAPALTARQRDIVDGIVAGATNADIARDLGIGVKTVEKHVSEILRRWHVESRVGIARIALAGSQTGVGE